MSAGCYALMAGSRARLSIHFEAMHMADLLMNWRQHRPAASQAAFKRCHCFSIQFPISYYIILCYITKASFAGLELPRLLNEVKYSNIRGEQPF